MKTGAIQAGIARDRGPAHGRSGADPDPDGRLRPRRHDVRDGRGEPGLLHPRHHGHDRCRLRRAGRRAILLLGCGIGVLGSTINPFATGSPPGSPASRSARARRPARHPGRRDSRSGIFFVMRYADRVKRDPTRRWCTTAEADNEASFQARDGGEAGSGDHDRAPEDVLALFFLAFVVMIYGVIPWEDLGIGIPTLFWWFPEMTASFLLFSILIGVVGRMREVELHRRVRRRRPRPARRRADHRHRPRHHGDHEQRPDHRHRPELGGAGRGDLGGVAFINLMFVLFLPLSFLIPSSSGLATVAMPIMAPLASLRERARGAGRHGLPDRQRPGEPGHADVRGRDGRAGHRARSAMAPGSSSCGRYC